MMYWLWRIILICTVFGSIQWMYSHPDSEMTQKALQIWAWMKMEWDAFDQSMRAFLDVGLSVKPAG